MAIRHYAGQPLINIEDYGATSHTKVSCLTCHPESAAFTHGGRPVGDCTVCHVRHHEKVTHDAHAMVSCEACHLWEVRPRREIDQGRILWERRKDPDGFSRIHFMPALTRDGSCMRCHFSGNTVGAAAVVLPAKSVICMPCHTATFSVGDTTTMLALIVFALGILGGASIWFSAGGRRMKGDNSRQKAFKGGRFAAATKVFLLDGLLQRRLFRVSGQRWIAHALVFFPLISRFVWGMTALVMSLWFPQHATPWLMIDKNHPVTAFFFDFSGLMMFAGIGIMLLRRIMSGHDKRPTGMPSPDWAALGLLGGILLVGFFLEGMRIAMTGSPAGSSWAFVGGWIGSWLTGFELTGIYGYVWYLHAILTGAFVAYLPFSRMLHMFAAPLALTMNAGAHHRPKLPQTYNKT